MVGDVSMFRACGRLGVQKESGMELFFGVQFAVWLSKSLRNEPDN